MKTIRLGVAGAGRGKTFMNVAPNLGGRVSVDAICDRNEETLKKVGDTMDGVRRYTDFQRMLEDEDLDAICIATPVPFHAENAIAALKADKHVLCEVPAAFSLEECQNLIQAARASKRTYMMAENYCFAEPILTVQEMVQAGVFGDLIHAHGAYIHDCRDLLFNEEGDLTWRGQMRRIHTANTYPTHSMGPVCRWLGIGRTDELDSLVAMGSPSIAAATYARKRFPHLPELHDGWTVPDSVEMILKTKNGVLINHRLDWASPRPHQMTRYGLQGTTACVTSEEEFGRDWLAWIEGRSETSPTGIARNWETLNKYYDDFRPALWKEAGEEARKTGHGGGDYFVLREFADAIREERPPLFDVYDAVTWSSLVPLSEQSIAGGGAPMKIPNWRAS